MPAAYGEDWDDPRREVYRRAGWRCQNCGRGNVELHAHHIVPLGVGGTNTPTNLACLCRDCHAAIHPHMRDDAPAWASSPAPYAPPEPLPPLPDAKLRW